MIFIREIRVLLLPSTSNTLWTHQHVSQGTIECYTPLWIHHPKRQLLHQPTFKPQTNHQVIHQSPTILPISKLESGLGTTKDKICRWLLRLSNVNLSRVHRVLLLPSTSDTLWTHQHLSQGTIECYTPLWIHHPKNKQTAKINQPTNHKPTHKSP